MSRFKFELDQPATIALSGESGVIIGRAEYSESVIPTYLVRYVSADKRAVEAWWTESALAPAAPLAKE